MADVLWKVFEAAVNFFESFVIIHFLDLGKSTGILYKHGWTFIDNHVPGRAGFY